MSDAPVVKPQINASAAKRANSTLIGMLLATLVSLAVALPMVLMSAHPEGQNLLPKVDASAAAAQVKDVAGFTALAPALPAGWSVNYARWTPAGPDGVAYWEIGYTSANSNFLMLTQTSQSNPTWLAAHADQAAVTGSRTVSGVPWVLRDKPGTSSSLSSEVKGTTVLLRAEVPNGSKSSADFTDLDALAQAVTAAGQAQK
ncbi:DUF4245 domain-containing protein [Psychromicrobium xiongbiense]|uniref:DUF4245 domain-containing protein n=1 Tax=Psychromicrobium xiongbiense TaxID=3051184 RepID=UPI002552290D|nr:DUF4245 domain-containing protein [Psychromicrobium sp. YIM S02556]